MARILIIEDEIRMTHFITLELKYEGHEVETAENGFIGLKKAMNLEVDLILLDIRLPDKSGIEVCQELRKKENRVPIIMLTAKEDITDKIPGLDNGVDDYIIKPIIIEELLARIRIVLSKGEEEKKKEAELTFGQLRLKKNNYSVYYGSKELMLTKKEFDLLEYLLRNKNHAITREQLLSKVWEYEYIGDTNVVDVYIRYLRQKIDDRFKVKVITTVRGVGYMIKDGDV